MTHEELIDKTTESRYPFDSSPDTFTRDLRNGIIKCCRASFKEGAEWEQNHLMNKACKWLEENFINECGYLGAGEVVISFNTRPAIDAFRKAMEE